MGKKLEAASSRVVILGVSAHYHDSAAALIIDGRIVAAAQEERFTRIKGDSALPIKAIESVLQIGGIVPAEITSVVFYENPFAKLDRQLAVHLLGRVNGMRGFIASTRNAVTGKLWVQGELTRALGRKVPIIYSDHHLSHAASAFYPSGFESAATLTIDGVGEWSTTTIGKGEGSKLELVSQIEFPNSLGLLYSAFTLYCGFKINSGEYKLMGLAPYGSPRFADKILDEVVSLHEDGSFSLNPELFEFFGGTRTYNKKFERLFGEPTRRESEDLTQFHADVAASIQMVTNKAVLGLARRAKELTGSDNLVMAGGVALNVVSIGELERAGIFKNIWVQPAAGDAGGSLGAALWVSYNQFGVERFVDVNDSMRGAFLGPEPDGDGQSISGLLERYHIKGVEFSDDIELASKIALAITEGQVVGLARGRMEYGPRALGARSVLADARSPEMQSRLNLKTKFREGFRPFAPLALAEKADMYFEMNGKESPYMLKTYPVRAEQRFKVESIEGSDLIKKVNQIRSTIPAVTHLDYSARVQSVDKIRNPFLHSVMESFDQMTGCPVLVNTSFNVRGEPIVCTATDAIECFLATDIDVLVLGNFYISRVDQDFSIVKARRSTAIKAD